MIVVTDEMLFEFLLCDPHNGELYWFFRERKWFKDNRSFNTWNSRYAGAIALSHLNTHGYYGGIIFGRRLLKHRVIFFMTNGHWPSEVDHQNGVRSDNRIINLRGVTPSQNQKNKKINDNNTSGRMGVGFHKSLKKYRAFLKHEGKQISLGYYDTLERAIEARTNGEILYGFHRNHGRC